MTELLYLKDSYLKEFTAKVIEVFVEENAVEINCTAFYPTGGGQPCDLGEIKFDGRISQVTKVKKIDGKIRHFLEGDLPQIGTEILGKINWERRYKMMRTHTAMHSLSAVVWRDYKAQVTGGNIEPLAGRLDFEFEKLNAEMISEIGEKVNAEIRKGLDVTSETLPRAEAEKIPDLIRTKINLLPPGLTEIRVVKIQDLDLQADGGTHVKNTSEIGTIKIVGYKSKGRINKRIKIEIV
ncbi:MAG: alanyl-tRNA editing protein [Candidatus Cloacimonetes bacterium]|nr:alanyl-tRNA editing protein [Candidatus Cloacimonadota bacterium]